MLHFFIPIKIVFAFYFPKFWTITVQINWLVNSRSETVSVLEASGEETSMIAAERVTKGKFDQIAQNSPRRSNTLFNHWRKSNFLSIPSNIESNVKRVPRRSNFDQKGFPQTFDQTFDQMFDRLGAT